MAGDAGCVTFSRPLRVRAVPDWTNGPNREVALEATRLWNTTFGRPLGYVAGEFTLAIAVTFYSPDGPSYVVLDRPSYSPWASLDQVKRGGLIVVCPETDGGCIRMGTDFAGDRGIRRAEEVSLRFRGRRGSPQQFGIRDAAARSIGSPLSGAPAAVGHDRPGSSLARHGLGAVAVSDTGPADVKDAPMLE